MLSAQDCPVEWARFCNAGYIYDVQISRNDKNEPSAIFVKSLLNNAIAGVSRKINLRVRETSELNKNVTDGQTAISYSSDIKLESDNDVRLLNTETKYDELSKVGYAIAFINKGSASKYWTNETELALKGISNLASQMEYHISNNDLVAAKSDLASIDPFYEKFDLALTWLNICDCPSAIYSDFLNQLWTHRQHIEHLSSRLRHGTTIYLEWQTPPSEYGSKMARDGLISELSSKERSFVDNASEVMWHITISSSIVRQQTLQVSEHIVYLSYVEAYMKIVDTKRNICTYEGSFTSKGADPQAFDKATQNAYKNLDQQLKKTIELKLSE